VEDRSHPLVLGDGEVMSFQRTVRFVAVLLGLAILFVSLSTAATAHKKDKHKELIENSTQSAGPAESRSVVAQVQKHPGAAVQHGRGSIMEGMEMAEDRSAMSFGERLLTWLGRLHPFIVHFPIAFFPAALFTAIVGRRRPPFSAPVQFLVVAGGIFAPLAAAAGWLAGMSADPEPILTYHRWLGVAIGITGAGLALWAWKRPWEDRGAGMILALTLMTVAIAVQGFLGAGVTHGMDHLMF
jgi:uncharacterized membrane protein